MNKFFIPDHGMPTVKNFNVSANGYWTWIASSDSPHAVLITS